MNPNDLIFANQEELPNFCASVERHKKVLSSSYWRYRQGTVPKIVRLLITYPELLEALRKDAEQIRTTPPHVVK